MLVRARQEIISQLPRHIKVVDLSADFRLRDVDTYAEWCGAQPSLACTCRNFTTSPRQRLDHMTAHPRVSVRMSAIV